MSSPTKQELEQVKQDEIAELTAWTIALAISGLVWFGLTYAAEVWIP